MSHILAVFYRDVLRWLILAVAAIAAGAVVVFAFGSDSSCKRCRPRARARGACICLIDCGHIDCAGDRPTIRAQWKPEELALLNGEIEWEDL